MSHACTLEDLRHDAFYFSNSPQLKKFQFSYKKKISIKIKFYFVVKKKKNDTSFFIYLKNATSFKINK